MRTNVGILALCAVILATPAARAQDNAAGVAEVQALRAAAQKDKRELVARTLELTPAEAKKFWPAYEAYRRSTDMANRERNLALEGLVGATKPMSDLYAKNLASALVTADDAEIKARRTLYKQVMKALPATKAARYLQLESKIRAMQAYDIAVAFPMIK